MNTKSRVGPTWRHRRGRRRRRCRPSPSSEHRGCALGCVAEIYRGSYIIRTCVLRQYRKYRDRAVYFACACMREITCVWKRAVTHLRLTRDWILRGSLYRTSRPMSPRKPGECSRILWSISRSRVMKFLLKREQQSFRVSLIKIYVNKGEFFNYFANASRNFCNQICSCN